MGNVDAGDLQGFVVALKQVGSLFDALQARRAAGTVAVDDDQRVVALGLRTLRVFRQHRVGRTRDGVNAGGGMQFGGGTLYYQKGNREWGCSSSHGTWYGMSRSTQGQGDLFPNGIGGHCDSCNHGQDLSTACGGSQDCFTHHKDVEMYISNWKDVHSSGAGGTTCSPMSSPGAIRYRFYAW